MVTKEDYKEQIRTMQEHIRSITDKSVKKYRVRRPATRIS